MLSPLRLWRKKEVSCGVSAFTLFLHFMQFHAPSWKVCRMSSVMTFTGSGHQVQECLRSRVNELLNLQLRPGRGEVQPAEVSFISERWGEEGEAGYIFTFRGDVGTGGDLWCHQMQASLLLSLPLFHVLDFTFHFLQILNNVCYEVDVHIFKNVTLSVSEWYQMSQRLINKISHI